MRPRLSGEGTAYSYREGSDLWQNFLKNSYKRQHLNYDIIRTSTIVLISALIKKQIYVYITNLMFNILMAVSL